MNGRGGKAESAERGGRSILRDERGIVLVLSALSMTMLIGFVALAVEVGLWYKTRRMLQTAADSASLAGAFAKQAGGNNAKITALASYDAARNGWSSTTGTIAVNNPPASGTDVGKSNAVEVILTRQYTLMLSAWFDPAVGTGGQKTVTARAVSHVGAGPATACIIGLDATNGDAVVFQNNAVSTSTTCGVYSDSSSSSGLHLNNNASIAGPVSVVGHYQLDNNSSLTGSPNTQGAPAIADPYANVNVPTPPSCTSQCGGQSCNVSGQSVTLSPGRFCHGWNFSNNATVTLQPGTYYVDQSLNGQNNVVIDGTAGVTIVLGSNFNVNIGNNATFNINAQTSGALAGIAMMSPRGSSSVVQDFANNAYVNVNGALYFPDQTVRFQNNGTTNMNNCTQVVAKQVQVLNNAVLGNNCTGIPINSVSMGTGSVQLSE